MHCVSLSGKTLKFPTRIPLIERELIIEATRKWRTARSEQLLQHVWVRRTFTLALCTFKQKLETNCVKRKVKKLRKQNKTAHPILGTGKKKLT